MEVKSANDIDNILGIINKINKDVLVEYLDGNNPDMDPLN